MLQGFVLVLCILLFCLVLHLIAKDRLLLRYSLLWIALVVVTFVSAVFPDGVYSLSRTFGFANPSNFIFFIGLFCLLAITLSLSVIASSQAVKIKKLTQRIALIEHEIDSSRSQSNKLHLP